MDVVANVRSTLSALVSQTADQVHREDHFTMMLCAELWPALRGRLLFRTGLGWRILAKWLEGTDAERIRQCHLPDTKDFYADLIVTDPAAEKSPTSTCSIDDVLKEMPIACLYEFKYLTSFTTLNPRKAREDTFKLKVLGEFVRLSVGSTPHMEQFVIASRRRRNARKPASVERLTNWFQDAEFRSSTEGVAITIVDTDGKMFTA